MVDNPVHDGVGGLREAIGMANANPGPDTITFDAALSGETIALGGNQLLVTDTVSIDATSLSEGLTIDAEEMSRIVKFSTPGGGETSGDLTLNGLTLTGGSTTTTDAPLGRGGGIVFMSNGTLTLDDSTLSGSSTVGDDAIGGGIYSRNGDITLNRSTVSGNRTGGARAFGGGIGVYYGNVTLNDSTVSGNRTFGASSQGGGIYLFTGNLSLVNSTVSQNSTFSMSSPGGGFFARSGAVTINGSHITGNLTSGVMSAGGGFGAGLGTVLIEDSVISGNRTRADDSPGGGVSTLLSPLTINRSTVSDNSTAGERSYGGGIAVDRGSLDLNSSTLSGNSTSGMDATGGGINAYSGNVLLSYSTASGNFTTGDYSRGGGINTVSGQVTITGATLSDNSTAGINADGGGFFTTFGEIVLLSSTITDNRVSGADSGGGGLGWLTIIPGSAQIRGSIVAGNSATTTQIGPDFERGLGTLTVQSSLIGDNADTGLDEVQIAGRNGNLVGQSTANMGAGIIDPLLGPLNNNGGLTETHALLAGSPAIDASRLNLSNRDQRGGPFVRSTTEQDIGAYELQTLDAALFVVTTTADEFDFTNSDVSLREAISAANGSPGANTITFGPLFNTEQTILLASQLPTISGDLTLTGPGAELLTIDAGNGADGEFGTGDGFRIFTINDGDDASFSEVSLSGLTLTGGDAAKGADGASGNPAVSDGGDGESGGAILSRENLTVVDSTISGNAAGAGGDCFYAIFNYEGEFFGSGGAGGGGGAIASPIGSLTLTGSLLSGNQNASGGRGLGNRNNGDGGAVFSGSGDVTVTDSRFEQNGREFVGDGGAIFNDGGTLNVTGSTFINNVASDGGAIASQGDVATVEVSNFTGNRAVGSSNGDGGAIVNFAELTVIASTFKDNTAANNGGAIETSSDTATIRTSTFAGNSAGDDGGAIANRGVDGVLNVELSTISGNMSTDNGGGIDNRDGTLNITASTITLNMAGGDGDGVRNRDGTLNITSSIIALNDAGFEGSEVNVVGHNGTDTSNLLTGDPLLFPLANNGGPTETHALMPNSPAIDMGTSTETNDQRGAPFVRAFTTGFGIGTDIGAYERQSVAGLSLIVDTTSDINDGDHSPGELSLREAIGLANGNLGPDLITFSSLFDTRQTILLTSQLPTISDSLTILGKGKDLLTIDAQNGADRQFNTQDGYRLLDINDGDDSTLSAVTLSGMTLTGGDVGGETGFLARNQGGAIRSAENLNLVDAAILNNAADGAAGVLVAGGNFSTPGTTLTLNNTSVNNNTANLESFPRSGGVDAQTVVLTDSTIDNNTGTGLQASGNITATRSAITNNTFGSGISQSAAGGVITLTDSQVTGNTGASFGGGISFFSDPFAPFSSDTIVSLVRSTVSGNMATGAGGGIIGRGDNQLPRYGVVTLIDSSVTDNHSTGSATYFGGAGGGINADQVTLTRSTVSGNSTADGRGGGINAFDVTLVDSTVSGNFTTGDGDHGGGIAAFGVDATNSTISGNRTEGDGAHGGGIFTERFRNTNLNRTTVTDNRVLGAGSNGGGIFQLDDFDTQALFLWSTIVAGNTATDGPADDIVPGRGGLVANFSLIGDATGLTIVGDNNRFGDPRLDPVASNGGPTQTNALLAGSPAIDAGTSAIPGLFGTGVSPGTENSPAGLLLGDGEFDSVNYTLVSQPIVNGFSFTEVKRDPNWLANTPTSQWISFAGEGSSGPPGEYVFRTTFDLTGYDLSTVSLSGSFASDNTGSITINDSAVDGVISTSFSELTPFTISTGFVAGINTLDFNVINEGLTNNPIGLHVSGLGGTGVLLTDQRGLARSADGGRGGGVDIGAFEAQAPPPALPGDYNRNGTVEVADFTIWRDTLGDATEFYAGADGNGDGVVDIGDYETWRNHFGDTILPTTLIGPNTLNGEFSTLTPNSGASQVDLSRGRVLADTGTPGTTVTIPGWEIERVNFQGGNAAFGFDGLSPLGSDGSGAPVDPVAFVNNDTVRLSTDNPIPFSFDAGDQVQLRYRVGSDNPAGTAQARLVFDRGLPTESTMTFDPIMVSTAGLTFEDNQTVLAPSESTTVSLEFILGELNPGGPGVQRTQLDSVSLTVFPALGMTQTASNASLDQLAAEVTTIASARTQQPITASASEESIHRVEISDAGFALLIADPARRPASRAATVARERRDTSSTDDTLLLLAVDSGAAIAPEEAVDEAFSDEGDEAAKPEFDKPLANPFA